MSVLFINACVRENSRTKELAEYLIGKLNYAAEEVDLANEKIAPLDGELLALRDSVLQEENSEHSILRYARQFASAETIVIAAPYWDLSFPALLKDYLEQICVTGVSFAYGEDGKPYGLCKAKKLYYVTTAGGPIFAEQFGFGYVEALCRMFFGINDVVLIKAEGLDIIGADTAKILDEAKKLIDLL